MSFKKIGSPERAEADERRECSPTATTSGEPIRARYLWLLILTLGVVVWIQREYPPAPIAPAVVDLRFLEIRFVEGDLATLVSLDPTNREMRIVTYQGHLLRIPMDNNRPYRRTK